MKHHRASWKCWKTSTNEPSGSSPVGECQQVTSGPCAKPCQVRHGQLGFCNDATMLKADVEWKSKSCWPFWPDGMWCECQVPSSSTTPLIVGQDRDYKSQRVYLGFVQGFCFRPVPSPYWTWVSTPVKWDINVTEDTMRLWMPSDQCSTERIVVPFFLTPLFFVVMVALLSNAT